MTFIKQNQNDRFKFIDLWADFVKNHSDKEWSQQQNRIINSCLRSASMTKEQFLYMKKETYKQY
ncbi:MAG: hypothetical protein QXL17_00370 [Candidatus Thermoplasmatota archaeon]